jgi:hypothetical protein
LRTRGFQATTAISIKTAICAGSRTGYGSRPENHASMSGSHDGPTNKTSSCPMTLNANSATQVQSKAAVERL